MPKKITMLVASVMLAAWLGGIAIEAFHSEHNFHEADCPVCFVIHSANNALGKIIPQTMDFFKIISICSCVIIISTCILSIHPDTPVSRKIRLDL